MAVIETVVTYLEMRAEPPHLPHAPAPALPKLMLMRAENPSTGFYRYLYDAVGQTHLWIDRKTMTDEALADIIRHLDVEVWVVYVAGQPAGYFEIDGRDAPAVVELMYLGITRDFQGLGLGKWLLTEAIRACWARSPERVIVETCTLDGPSALPLYQKMGFAPYDRRTKTITVPD